MPSFRHSSLVLAPASTCCSAAIICSSVCALWPIAISFLARSARKGLRLLQFPSDQFPGFGSQKVADLAREHGVSEATIYTWKSKYGGLEVSDAQGLRQLEQENRRLKNLVADLSLDKEVLKAVITKNGWASQLNGKM